MNKTLFLSGLFLSLSSFSVNSAFADDLESKKSHFIAGCMDRGAPKAYCDCVLSEIESTEGFAFLDNISKTGPNAKEKAVMTEIGTKCMAKHGI